MLKNSTKIEKPSIKEKHGHQDSRNRIKYDPSNRFLVRQVSKILFLYLGEKF